MVRISVERLTDTATLPRQKNESDAGFDLFADEDVIIPAGEQRVISTGIKINSVQFPVKSEDGYVYLDVSHAGFAMIALLIWPRSGMDSKWGLHTGAGVIDQDYRGEILVLLKNTGKDDYPIRTGDKIAQMIPTNIYTTTIYEEEKTIETARGKSGGIAEVKDESS